MLHTSTEDSFVSLKKGSNTMSEQNLETGNAGQGSKVITWILIIAIVAGMGGFIYYQYTGITKRDAQISTLSEEKAVVENANQQLTTNLNEVTSTIEEVANKLQDVRKLHVAINDLATSSATTETSKKGQLLSDIAAIESQLERDKKDLSSLTSRIKQSGVKIKSLETMVANLKKELDKNVQQVTELRTALEQKDQQLRTTQNTLKETETTLASVKTELNDTSSELTETKNTLQDTRNTAYFAVGTKRELIDRNVIDEHGRLFKSLTLAGDINESGFNKIDITKDSEFTVTCKAKNVKVIPQRSETSYTVEASGDNQSVIKITDPEKFWKIKYMAVIVKS